MKILAGIVRSNCARAPGHHTHGVRKVLVLVISNLLGAPSIDDHGDEVGDPPHEDNDDENSLEGFHK